MSEIDLKYKQSRIGKIPIDWDVTRIEEIADIDNKSLNSKTSPNYEFKYISLSDVKEGKLNSNLTTYTFENAPSRARRIVKKNDILMSTVRPNLKGFGYIKNSILDTIASTGFSVISCKKSYCAEFLYHNLFGHNIESQIYGLVVGSNYPAINSSEVRKLKLPFPPIHEQEKIAEILSTWDSAIEKQEQLIEKKKEFKRGLMQRLLSGEVRFKNFKDDWKTYKVNNLTKQVINKNKDGNISLVLSVTNKKGFITQEEQFEKQVASKDLSNYKIVRKGEFAYNPSRINVGSIDLLTKFNEGLLSPMYIVFKCDEQLLSEYYNYWIKTNMFKKQMDKYLSGSVRETLSFEDMGLMKIKLPSMEEQKMIVDLLNNMNTEIELLEKELEALKLQKKGLMQRLLTGEVRVKV